ncbi:MAG: hypothetical protein L6455_15275 [Kiritimatiellae bacterium]|nr:hypothetical protein [Kiritimatiellia bacterium]
MRIPGIVDVYRVGNEWVARSWPKPAHQPNSAEQLLWRQKFTDAHAVLKLFGGSYLSAWRLIECPPGKMWIDIAMTSAMGQPDLFFPDMIAGEPDYRLYHYSNPLTYPFNKYRLICISSIPWFPLTDPYLNVAHGSLFSDVMKWNDCGYICPKGKRPKIRWVPSFKQIRVASAATSYVTDVSKPYTISWYDEFESGMSISSLATWPDPTSEHKRWALTIPPIYVRQQPWTFGEEWWNINF